MEASECVRSLYRHITRYRLCSHCAVGNRVHHLACPIDATEHHVEECRAHVFREFSEVAQHAFGNRGVIEGRYPPSMRLAEERSLLP